MTAHYVAAPRPSRRSIRSLDQLGVPDILPLLTEELAVVDNLSGTISLTVYADPPNPDAFQRATERLAELQAKLREPAKLPLQHATTVVNANCRWAKAPTKRR